MKGTLLVLGSGGSMGVPQVGCDCSVCSSSHPKNSRLRPSLFLQCEGKSLLIDASPDFRIQALKNGINHLDGIMITHTHYDHVGGLDDLRVFSFAQKGSIPCLLSKESQEELLVRYGYLFLKNSQDSTFHVEMDPIKLESDFGEVRFLGLPIQYVSFKQGKMKVTGYRFGDTAYLSDISHFDKKVLESLRGIKQIIISAPRKEGSNMHLSLDSVLQLAENLAVKKLYLSHLCHEMDYQNKSLNLPAFAEMAYDGLKIPVSIS